MYKKNLCSSRLKYTLFFEKSILRNGPVINMTNIQSIKNMNMYVKNKLISDIIVCKASLLVPLSVIRMADKTIIQIKYRLKENFKETLSYI